MLRAVSAVDEIIRVHECPDVRLFHGSLERRQVDFAERALVDIRAHPMPVVFLIVSCVMLHRCHDPLTLNPLNVRDHHPARQVGIFTIVFEVATAHWRAIDIHSG